MSILHTLFVHVDFCQHTLSRYIYTFALPISYKRMTSQKRPATLLPEETYIDDHSDETNTEWEKITQDSVVFERECIEDDLTEQKPVILLQENPSSISHCRYWGCVPTKLNGEPNIRSAFRFNLKDVSGRYYGKSSHSAKTSLKSHEP